MHEIQLRKQMVEIAHLCYERGLLVALDGNLSARLPSGDILCTKAGCHKGLLTNDDIVTINMKGKVLRGHGKPTSEMAMHLACYRARPDIKAVVHAHPPMSVAFTIANISLARCILPEVVLTLGTIPTIEYATTGTSELAARVGDAILNHDAILMDRHGAVCVGRDLLEAFCRLEVMEHTAIITKNARDLGAVKELPSEEAVRLRSMGLKRYGGPPSAVEKADSPCVDLPDVCTGCSGCAAPSPEGVGHKGDFSVARLTNSELKGLEQVLVEAALKALK